MARRNEAFEALHVLLSTMETPRSEKATLAWSRAWRVVHKHWESAAFKRKTARLVERAERRAARRELGVSYFDMADEECRTGAKFLRQYYLDPIAEGA